MNIQRIKVATAAIALSITCLITINGCKKDNQNLSSTDDIQSVGEEIGQSEDVNTTVDNMTSQVSRTGTFSHSNCQNPDEDQFNFRSCATVTNDSINHVITFDFGTGCTGHDGRVRSGQIIVNYTGSGYFDAGSSWVVTFQNYYEGGRHIEGSRSVVNNGFNTAGNMTWTITATNMKITRPDGHWRTWNGMRTREMIAGFGDSLWTNDVYKINGTMSGNNDRGDSVNSVLTDLIRDNSCQWITSGIIVTTPSNRPVHTINFGSGTCDDEAIVTRNGVTRTIHLRF